MRILSINSPLGTQVVVVDTVPSAVSARALQVPGQNEQADIRRRAESLGQTFFRALLTSKVTEYLPDVVVAATGPASFAGLRARLVTTRIVGRTRGVPIRGAPSLDAVTHRALGELKAREGQTGPVILAATDVRRREIYTALLHANGPDDVTRLTKIIVCPPAQVVQHLTEQTPEPGGGNGGIDAMAGSGASPYPELAGMISCRKALAPVSGGAPAQVCVALTCLERDEELNT